MAKKLVFKNADAAKNAIMDSQKKEIAALYKDWADEIGERANFYSHKSTASAPVSERYYKELKKQLTATSQEVSNEVYKKIKSNIYTVSDAVVKDNIKWLESYGFSSKGLNAAFSYVPDEIVRNLITGQIYESGWSLSKSIWSDNEATLKDIYQIMAKGMAEQKPIYQIAKELEAYVDPSRRLPWNLTMSDGVKIYKKQVDYNAQRLARTLVQHGYQQSFLATTQNNPFVLEYIWRSNGSRVCDLCKARDGVHFKKTELPMDHPNGMCTMEPVVPDNMVDQLADWFNSPDGTYPEIDEFAGNFGYQASKTGTINDYLSKYGKSDKNPSAWYHSMSPIQKAEAKILKDMEGLKWDEFYEKYVYSGSASDLAAYKAKTKAAKNVVNKVDDDTADLLKKAGFKDSVNPSKFDSYSDWFWSDADFDEFEKLSKLLGEKKFNEKVLKEFFDNVKAGEPNIAKIAIKETTKKAATTKVAKETTKAATKTATDVVNKIDDVFDSKVWYDSVRSNDLREMNQWTKDWLNVITTTEKSGVVTYTGSAYWDMNEYLRGLRGKTNYQTAINNCNKALAKASLPRETIVRRGSGYNMLNDLGIGNITKDNVNNFIGGIVEDKGFVSTSPSPHGGFSGSIEYVIKLPKGSQAMYVDSISKHKGEEELLINCGGKYIVEGVEFDRYGEVNRIYMTLINLIN